MFQDAPIIYQYTNEDAIRDGIKVQLRPGVFATTNLMERIGSQFKSNEGRYPLTLLLLSIAESKLLQGVYFDEGATKYPEECNENFACYLVRGEKVWAIRDAEGLHFILPEDY